MSKRHVAYIKPDEPSFLKKLKKEAGYQEGPTVDTKRERGSSLTEEDLLDPEEEQPTVVVLKPGDLTAEEAAREEARHKKEQEEAPADLDAPIVFRPRKKNQPADTAGEKSTDSVKKSKKLKTKSLLSFDEEEHDD